MFVKELSLKKFRSHTKSKFEFSPQTTIILGPNTSGKTNILEALFLLSVGKSFRAESERDMVAWGTELSRTKGRIIEKVGPVDLEAVVTTGEVTGQKTPIKRFLVNGVARRQIDFVGKLRVVLFWPEDLELVTDSPSLRRRYLDFVLVQIDREYRRNLLSYEKGIRQRNRLLEKIRDSQASRNQLLFWDQLIIKTGSYLTDARLAYIVAINKSDKPFGNFHLVYDHSFISAPRLAQYAEEEVAAASTLVGPHRDDLGFLEGKRDLSKFGSRGEQRLAVLWLKLAELEFLAVRGGDRPVLLLDDIFSELDHAHRDEVVAVIAKQQTILTTTDRHFLPESLIAHSEMIELGK